MLLHWSSGRRSPDLDEKANRRSHLMGYSCNVLQSLPRSVNSTSARLNDSLSNKLIMARNKLRKKFQRKHSSEVRARTHRHCCLYYCMTNRIHLTLVSWIEPLYGNNLSSSSSSCFQLWQPTKWQLVLFHTDVMKYCLNVLKFSNTFNAVVCTRHIFPMNLSATFFLHKYI